MVQATGVNFTNQFAQCAKAPHKAICSKNAVLLQQHFCWNFTSYFRLKLLHRVPYFDTFLPIVVAIKSTGYYSLAPKMLLKLTQEVFLSYVCSPNPPTYLKQMLKYLPKKVYRIGSNLLKGNRDINKKRFEWKSWTWNIKLFYRRNWTAHLFVVQK
jgi:hypothetical protein